MKPTAKHDDEDLRIAIAGCEEVVQDYGALPVVYREYLRTVLASLEAARADTRRMDYLDINSEGLRETIDAAIDRAATSAQGEAK